MNTSPQLGHSLSTTWVLRTCWAGLAALISAVVGAGGDVGSEPLQPVRWRTTRAIALNSLALLSTILERRAAASSSAATLRHSTRSSLQTTRV